MMNAEEQEYMDYLIHNRTQLTNQITRHLDEIDVLQKNMKSFLHIAFCVACCAVLVKACVVGVEKEARRQCIVAMDRCEKYGACDSEFLKGCKKG